VAHTHRTDDWNSYRMETARPFLPLEPLEQEIAVVDEALSALHEAGILPHTTYDHARLLAHREAVAERFEIPWTAITPRMQRLLYAINAIVQPQNMIAAGVFCGNTFISNAGAGVGPGACYTARNLIGVEIDAEAAAMAERNARRIDDTGVARVLGADARQVISEFPEPIDLLYIDADGDPSLAKGIYLEILETALPRLSPGAVVLAHNSVNGGRPVQPYLEFVRGADCIRASVNIVIDVEGLEVSQVGG
jgi:predicted O-methyltransferase YrrM